MLFIFLLIVAILLCRKDVESLILVILIGISYHLPVEYIRDKDNWYMTCILAELTVGISALFLSTRASFPVFGICIMLITGHILDWNHQSGQTYYIIANYLEYLEIIACIVFSPMLLDFIKERIRYCVQRS